MWTLHLLEPDNHAYVMCAALRFRGSLDIGIVRRAVGVLVERHETLRTVFRAGCDEPYAVVLPAQPVDVDTVDLRAHTDNEKSSMLRRWAEDEVRRPISLSRYPLFRFSVVRLSPDEHVIVLSAHHIIADDWSRALLLEEFAALVHAFTRNTAPTLPPVEARYVDAARDEAHALTSERREALSAYWKARLSGDLSPLQLPSFLPRPAVQSHRGALKEFAFSEELSAAILKTAASRWVSPFTVVLAGLDTLLHRYTGRENLIVGTAFNGRERGQHRGVVGNYVNTVALRTELSGSMTFGELLDAAAETVAGARAHADLPFERVVDAVKPPRDPSCTPLFQIMLVMLERPLSSSRLPDPSWSPLQVHNGTAKFDLTCLLWEDEGTIHGAVEYCTDVLDGEFIDRFLTHLRVLLAAALENPCLPLHDLPFVSESERRWLIHDLNATETPYDSRRCVHELFEEAARRSPDSTAVEFENLAMSYRELNERSNRLAHRLREGGVTRGIPVAIALERSPHMITALLGIIKSGGFYVPLDPRWPVVRSVQVLSSLHVANLVTQSSLLPLVEGIREAYPELARLVSLDASDDLERMPADDPLPAASSDDLAYVIFTSGSTGTPKGVAVKHKRVVNLIEWVNRTFSVGPADRLLFVTSLCFDLSVYDVFGILAAGGVVSIASSADLHDPSRLVRLLCDRSITFWDSAPAMLQQLAPSLPTLVAPDRNGSLRLVFLSGDWIPLTLPDAVRTAFPNARVIGLGGATEATVWSNWFPIARVKPEWRSIPYGKPIQNAKYYVLDARLSPCPVGVAGDLYIGGECLAEGYANDPEKTRERFVRNPFSSDPAATMYRTGDRARFMPDGNIEFLGRSDHQVKIRGFRIEAGEVESALARHAAVRDAVVVARGKTVTERELVAYLTFKDDARATVTDLRRHLKELIPEYMIPASWVFLDRIPLTPNGKVDLNALPDPDGERPDVEEPFVEPRDGLETTISRIWGESLGIAKVGVRDRFFDLGGTSLKAVQVMARINRELGIQMSPLAVFETPTVGQLVERIRGSGPVPASGPCGNARAEGEAPSPRRRDVAIVGMAARFPGARNVEEFWSNLRAGVESFTALTDEELLRSGVDPELLRNPSYVRVCSTIDDVESFDAEFFAVNPREAELMDPQHRVFLECAWSALEDAGYDPRAFRGSIGIFGGVARNAYFTSNIAPRPDLLKEAANYTLILGYDKDYAAMRTAYKLDLRGPAVGVQTACSTSGVALHLACQSLAAGDCDLALVGGCRIIVPAKAGYLYIDGGTLSSDGHVRAFDADANGMVRGSGVGFVVLKRLDDALRDGDAIRAVVRGSAVNNDGSDKIGFTAPSVSGQATAVAAAIRSAGITADTLGYLEAHGTGTTLGDPIEVAALTKAFRESTDRKGFCLLGSVKTNIGHLDAGACVASIIKTVLALEHGEIPPTLNFRKPNPRIDFAESPFTVADRLREWPETGTPRRAGVNSVGLGGTNVHIVLEQAPARQPSSPSLPCQLLLLSGRSAEALDRSSADLADHLSRRDEVNLADAAYTLQVGRARFAHRRYAVCRDARDAIELLKTPDGKRCGSGIAPDGRPECVFMFPGQGSQHVGMSRGLYEAVPFYKSIVDECSEELEPPLGKDLRSVMFPSGGDLADAAEQLDRTAVAQPALFVTEYALARLWMELGTTPSAMIGHSIGEYAAACLAGVFSLSDALRIVAARANLMQAMPSGSMCAVPLAEEDVAPFLGNGVSLAAVNAPRTCVLSGPREAIGDLVAKLGERGIRTISIRASHAFHSAMMDPVLAPFTAEVARCRLSPPRMRFVSSLTGTWITAAQAVDPSYWALQLRNPVRFSDGLRSLRSEGNLLLVEAGPGTVLSSHARKHVGNGWEARIVPSLPRADEHRSALESFLAALGQAWIAGADMRWSALHDGQRRYRIPLPTYPFERTRYWIEPPARRAAAEAVPSTSAAPEAPAARSAAAASLAETPPAKETTRRERVVAKLRKILADFSGVEFGDGDLATGFVEMGLDSLLLTQIASNLQDSFGVPVRFRQLLENLSSLNALAEYLDAQIPSDAPVSVSAESAAAPQTPPAPDSPPTADADGPTEAPRKAFGAGAQIDRTRDRSLTAAQQAGLDEFVARYVAKTRGSKEHTQEHRAHFADPRTVTGFSPQLKELVYPIVVNRSRGSRMWDIDGNEYIDLTGCFGANLLGYSPPFIMRALRQQLGRGIEIGPQHPLAGPAARLMCEITGFERVVFCNTGSEAVMGAMRLVRAVSGRNVIVTFTHSYHGNFDEVLVRGTKKLRSLPAAPGIPPQSVENLLVLEYGAEESLRIIRERAGTLAAVMVEPVQTRDLSHQPREFLHRLRSLTEELGIALIFDELVTGFRVHLGGAQAYFGVRADIATYGKIIAAGMPIGAIAGAAKYMDALDGGFWKFGDGSIPEVGVTYFAGTFVRHPLAMAASVASLEYLKKKGPGLQLSLNRTMDRFVDELHGFFAKVRAPLSIKHFGSACRFYFATESPWNSLFYPWLRSKGIHIYENRTWFLTTAHSRRDMALTVRAIEDTVSEMMRAGFLAPLEQPARVEAIARRSRIVTAADAPVPGARLGRDPRGDVAWYAEDPRKPGRYRRIGAPLGAEDGSPSDARAPVQYDPFAHGEVRMVVPATESQKEIWLTARMSEGGSCAFNESVSVRLRGPLDLDSLRAAVRGGIQRHEAMRMTFTSDGSHLCVAPSLDIEVGVLDLSALSDDDRASGLERLLRKEVTEPFDLLFGPLVRATVVKLGPDDHQLVITSHHIVCDGWSIDVVVKDIGAIYTASKRNEPAGLPEAERYSWYAAHVADLEAGQEYADAERYWLGVFSDGVPSLDLPTDHARPPGRTFESEQVDLPMDPALLEGVKQTASRLGCTLVTVLLAGFNALLHRLTGQEDIVVGLPAAGQSMVGKDFLVGHCVNLLPLRSRPAAGLAFSAYAKEFRSLMLDAYEHQQITFGRLLKKMRLHRDPSRIPLVSTIFNIDTGIDLGGMRFDDLEVDFRANPRAFENFEVFLNVSPTKGGQFMFELTYNRNLFRAETAKTWLRGYDALLRGIAADPDRTLAELPLLPPEEHLETLRRWNPPRTEYPRDTCVHELFARQAERRPDATAVGFETESLTYRQLQHRAAVVADHLAGLGAGRGDLVGVLVERSTDMVTAVLGVLGSGAAYVPLDPSFPRERLASTIDDAGCAFVLTQRPLLPLLPEEGPRAVLLEDIRSPSPSAGGAAASRAAGPNDLAYVIYTSGSTGKPKGVEVTHRALANFLWSMRAEPGLNERDVLLAVTTLSFDIAGLELYLPLIVGARTVIASRDTAADGKRLLEALRSSGATVMQATPTTWRLLLEAGWRSAPGFRALCGGEALPRELANAILDAGAELWNLYGPTETTIWSALCRIERGDEAPPIGHPIANTDLYVLDASLKPLPLGVPGELHIGGEGLARGYHGRQDLTEEKFVADPFSPQGSGARLYRTGDLVQRLGDGTLKFLGRTDNQVKLRGYRVELGDIEAHLESHPGVGQCAAVIREDAPGMRRLVAYYVAGAGSPPKPDELRAYLRERLPAYMVPSLFVALQKMPLTPNGKIDRKSLPKPEADDTGRRVYIPPANKTEARLARLWERLLDMRPVSVEESFFDLGGDSLLAARLFAELERSMGRAVPLATLFAHPTIRSLAKVLERTETRSGWSSLVPVQPKGSKPPLYLVHGAEGNVLLYRELADSLGADQPVFGLQSRGLDGASLPAATIEEMAIHYVDEILRHDPRGPYHLGGYCMGGAVAMEMAHLLIDKGREVRLLALIETYNIHAASPRFQRLLDAYNALENVAYHLLNMLAAGRSGDSSFLRQKYRVQARRFRDRLSIALSAAKAALDLPNATTYHHRRIDRANEAAHHAYVPRPYAGKAVLFRPLSHYTGYRDPLFGWGSIVRGGVEVHTLPVHPRGMLVQPFVRDLARGLERLLRDGGSSS